MLTGSLTCLVSSAVTPHVSPTWECTWLTWPSLRREHPTTLKTTLSTSPRWEWYRTSNFNLVLLCKVFFTCVWFIYLFFMVGHVWLLCDFLSFSADISHYQRDTTISANSLQDWLSTKGEVTVHFHCFAAFYFLSGFVKYCSMRHAQNVLGTGCCQTIFFVQCFCAFSSAAVFRSFPGSPVSV